MTTKQRIIDEAVHESRDKRARRRILFNLAFFLVSLAILLAAGTNIFRDVKSTADDGLTLAEEVAAACADTTTPNYPELCEKAEKVVEDAPGIVNSTPGPVGPQGESGPPPSDSQVSNAVRLFCQENDCDGANGRDATTAQVAAAVSLYCTADGQCRGPQGQEGPRGQQGPAPSDAQVLAAVTSYCSSSTNCVGPQGPRGEPGSDAPADGGAVNVNSQCDNRDGQIVSSVNATYDSSTRTITLTCTYTSAGGILPPPEGES